MLKLLLVFLGGGIGSSLRYLASVGLGTLTHGDRTMPREDTVLGLIPLSTLGVNVVGCLLIGLLMPVLSGQRDEYRLLLTVGVLGGFTTFSAFGHETVVLIEQRHAWLALAYAAGSVVAGVGAALLGGAIAGRIGG